MHPYILVSLSLTQPIIELPTEMAGADEVRAAYQTTIRETNYRRKPNAFDWTTPLIALHQRLPKFRRVSHSEKTRMRNGLELRLSQMRQQLERHVRRARLSEPGNHPAGRRTFEPNPGTRSGPAEVQAAQRLIALIQTTIAPDSWQSNGGLGSIVFYEPLNVLVVRATGEVHNELGGVLNQLR